MKSIARLLLLPLAMLIVLNVKSQEKKAFAGIQYGLTLPMGEMASHEFGYGGYALLGTCYGMQAGYYFNRHLGVGVNVSFKRYRFATGYYLEDYIATEPFFSHADMLSTDYRVQTFMAGLLYNVPVSKKLTAIFRLMGGLLQARTPDQFYAVDAYQVGAQYFWKTSALSRKPSFLAAAGIHYELYKEVSLGLESSFSYARSAFTFEKGTGTYVDLLHMPVLSLEPELIIKF